jgi:predicted phage terminase large subunit-like protein
VEDAANGPAIIDSLRGRVNGIIPIRPDGSKQARLSAVSPLFESGQVFIPRNAPWLIDYEIEMTQFPMAKHDDQVDATSMALRRLSRGGGMSILFPRRKIIR